LARFSAVCPLSGHACKWPFVVRRYGRCCMYGPNYAELGRGRVFAVQLFSMCLLSHHTALPPVRSDPHWPHSRAITASIRLALTHALQHPLLATQTSAVVTTACLDYLHLHTQTVRPSTASPICLYACSQRILGVAPPPLALDKTQAKPHAGYPVSNSRGLLGAVKGNGNCQGCKSILRAVITHCKWDETNQQRGSSSIPFVAAVSRARSDTTATNTAAPGSCCHCHTSPSLVPSDNPVMGRNQPAVATLQLTKIAFLSPLRRVAVDVVCQPGCLYLSCTGSADVLSHRLSVTPVVGQSDFYLLPRGFFRFCLWLFSCGQPGPYLPPHGFFHSFALVVG
jgi:hypothetical protein